MIFDKAIERLKEKIKRYETERIKGISKELQFGSLTFMRGELQSLIKCRDVLEKEFEWLTSEFNFGKYSFVGESTDYIQGFRRGLLISRNAKEIVEEILREVELK